MGILRADRITGLGGANAIKGSTFFGTVGGATYGNQIEIQKDSELDIGNGNLTVECWFNSPHISGYQSILGQEYYNNFTSNKVSFNFYLNNDGIYLWNRESGSAEQKFGVTGLWVASTWNHVAWVREGTGSNENKIYLNGSLVGSAFTNDVTYSSEQKYHIGGNFYSQTAYGQYPYKGHISNLRMSNIARYTANFTPPTSEFTVDSNTILLTCQSPSNILKEETGKTLSHNTLENNTPAQASRFTPNSPVGFSTTTDVGGQYGATFDGFGNFSTSTYMVPPSGNTRERNRGRGVLGGGVPVYPSGMINTITYIEIQTTGNSQDFGDLTVARGYHVAGQNSSSTRGLNSCGWNGSGLNTIDFITIANTANAIDFGDTSVTRMSGGLSNQTRGVHAGTVSPFSNVIDFVTIATTGDAQNFGDLVEPQALFAGTSSSTRGVFAGGRNNTPSENTLSNVMQYITIASTGNAQDFGDLQAIRYGHTGFSSPTRGIFAGGYLTPGQTTSIDFFTIATLGNSEDFGDLSTASGYGGSVTNSIRGIITCGDAPNYYNILEFITIATQGDAKDFGDTDPSGSGKGQGDFPSCISDSHGGL